MKILPFLFALLAVAIVPLAGAMSTDDCIVTYCNAGLDACTEAMCPEVVFACASSCDQIYHGGSSQCVGACTMLGADPPCLDELMPSVAGRLVGCWGSEKPALCAENAVAGLSNLLAQCTARRVAEGREAGGGQAHKCPPNSVPESEWGEQLVGECVDGCCCSTPSNPRSISVGESAYVWDAAGNCIKFRACPQGSYYSALPVPESYPVQDGFCQCYSAYKVNYPKTACLKCDDDSVPKRESCEWQNGENCKTCPKDCACNYTYEICAPESPNSNSIGCLKSLPVVTIIRGRVTVLDGSNERTLTSGMPVKAGETVRLYTDPYEDAFVELRWPDGKIGRAILPKEASGSDIYNEFVVNYTRSATGRFDKTGEVITDTVVTGVRGAKIAWWIRTIYKGVKIASVKGLFFITGITITGIHETRTPLGAGITYININSEIALQPMPDGSLVLTTLEGSPEIVYPGGNVTVPAGTYSIIGPSGPSQPQPFDPSKLDRWWERYGGGADYTLIIIIVAAAAVLIALLVLKRKRARK